MPHFLDAADIDRSATATALKEHEAQWLTPIGSANTLNYRNHALNN